MFKLAQGHRHDEDGHDHCCSHRGGAATESLDEVFFNSSKSVHKAVLNGNASLLKSLLDQKPEAVHACDSSGYAPILYVKNIAVLDLLKAFGADVNVCTPQGKRTLLHRASMQGNEALVAKLLQYGAACTRTDAEGQTAEQLAQHNGQMQIVELLKRS